MDDHIIKAAQQAGFRTGNITLSDSEIKPIPFIAPVSAADCQHEIARLYAIAFQQGLEVAINAVKDYPYWIGTTAKEEIATAIRAHAQNQPKPIHDSSVV